tara:strand:- start:118 stop:945 length:828 start_codon:yes stop_codon:yes gene_type:complete
MAAKKVEENVLRFTEDGIEAFENYIQEKRDNPSKSVPNLAVAGNVEQYIPTGSVLKIEIPQTDLWHHELADHIIGFFDTNKIDIQSTFGNRGLWTYLSYLFLDKHLSRKGHKPKKSEKYIVQEGTWSYYRHALTAMCWIRTLHTKNSGRVLMLTEDTQVFGDSYEQILASPIYQSKAVFELLDDLYFHDDGMNVWRSSIFLNQNKTEKDKNKPSLRKFKQAISRLAMTYHLPSLSVGRLKALLPKELREYGSIIDDPLPTVTVDADVGKHGVPIA